MKFKFERYKLTSSLLIKLTEPTICSDEGPTLEISSRVFQTLYDGKILIINASLDKPNSC